MTQPNESPPADGRPSLWVGHVALAVPDPAASKRFFLELGLRDAEPGSGTVGILELRGGTHLLLFPGGTAPAGTPAPFDLMVDDLEAFHAAIRARGYEPGAIEEGDFHRFFTIAEPGGHVVTVNSSHVTDQPV